ncbi:hypothetical protein SAMN05444722_0790 [Rhodovulum sp. ES.010]|uniref:hypothetical protein n=1 Tax=Rhodovulum sp. ES.010 TaxID=1882821 RepID=UPI000928F7A0|nr:hypothetical protein [Rhodovulum sp. ES.010]SIO19786.1 hypothetical protein SAMN05444722_0790 [Rhodovulum sp. ES.010]
MEYRPAQIAPTAFRAMAPSVALLVGFGGESRPELGMPFAHARCERLPFALLHAALACAPETDFVASPLVCRQFDALDMATQLALAGYRGRYVVVTPALPAPGIIRQEIRQLCPGLEVELIPRARN